MLKDFAKILLAAIVFTSTIMFPLVKIGVMLLFIGFFIYQWRKWGNWTFLIPAYGATFNAAAIVTNGNKIPAFNPPPGSLDVNHVAMGPHTHLKALCDVYTLGHLGVFSYGDILIAVIWPLTVLGYMWYRKYRKVGND